jgi:hypothetical protein
MDIDAVSFVGAGSSLSLFVSQSSRLLSLKIYPHVRLGW